ncbi:MAG: SbcC/MukB-like Walker B domain-containing protein, partial [Thermoguttaceae bacterium]
KERQERRNNYQKALAEKGVLEETWKRAVGEYAKEKAQELRDSVGKRVQKRAEAQGRRDAANGVIGDNPRPNIEELRERQRVAEEASAAADKRREAAANLAKDNASAYAMLAKKMEERGSLSKEYSRIESLYTKLSGKTTGAGKSTVERMDVETFVQRYYLGMALYSANKRFSKMSGGQYELRLRKLDQQSGGAKDRGLDLMVYSNVTGQTREASTLSGGESFIAALALAMGMADQIQEKSSAINLDVMFIDEGFGSLDDHSRAQAVGALKQIADGSKLIGVISHVNELKREIDSQLVVTKGRDGSRAEWRLC